MAEVFTIRVSPSVVLGLTSDSRLSTGTGFVTRVRRLEHAWRRGNAVRVEVGIAVVR